MKVLVVDDDPKTREVRDITMPRMNGFEVVKAIRRVSDVPLVMLTGRGDDVEQVRGLVLGADDAVAAIALRGRSVFHTRGARTGACSRAIGRELNARVEGCCRDVEMDSCDCACN